MGKSFWELTHVSPAFDPTNRYVTAYLLSPFALALVRLIISLYAFVTIIFRFAYAPAGIDESFSYFTNLGFWGIAFYFLFAGFHTLQYARTGHSPLQRWGKFLQFMHGWLYTTVVTFPFLVTGVYWALLAPDTWFPEQYEAWSNISVHALNAFFALVEILLPRTDRLPWLHIPLLLLLLAGYLGVAYITHATRGFYTYSFLDPNKDGAGMVAAYAGGILVATVVVFLLVQGLLWGKVYVAERLFGWGIKGERRAEVAGHQKELV